MQIFQRALAAVTPDPRGRSWLYVPYDQLSDQMGPLAREDPARLGIVLVESLDKASRRPYHKQKLALVLANQRRFALEQAARGVAIHYVATRDGYAAALRQAWHDLAATAAPTSAGLRAMRPAEWELRTELAPLLNAGLLEELPHEGWLTASGLFRSTFAKGPPFRMDAFYRRARRATGLLMDGDAFLGGQLSFDAENRKPWRGEPLAPRFPTFGTDAIKEEVIEEVASRFGHHPGDLVPEALPTTLEDAERLWRFALDRCLVHFGPFEDAMSRRSKTLFHTCISPLLNLHRLLPARVVADAAAHEAAPIASREGFVRQVLGWREFMHHVHEETGGLRRLPEASPGARRSGGAQPCAEAPGDGGYRRWRAGQGEAVSPAPGAGTGRGTTGLGGSAASFLGAADPVPPAYWGQSSGLACLDHVVSEVWADGWTHHINRLMVLSNLATLLDLSPRELADWFWVGFVDAFDWVVEPNVMGMGTFGLGALFVTKPYVSGAAYLDRMSDYCGACTFRPKQNCPITSLYWAFLERHQDRLAGNPRMAMPLRSLEKRGETRRAADRDIAARVRRGLAEGKRLTPALLGEPSTP